MRRIYFWLSKLCSYLVPIYSYLVSIFTNISQILLCLTFRDHKLIWGLSLNWAVIYIYLLKYLFLAFPMSKHNSWWLNSIKIHNTFEPRLTCKFGKETVHKYYGRYNFIHKCPNKWDWYPDLPPVMIKCLFQPRFIMMLILWLD